MPILFTAMPTNRARALQGGGVDDYDNLPLERMSDGDAMPCRHCLRNIGAGEAYLIAAYRPFTSRNPFAETGPIFVHAQECSRADDADTLPEILDSADYIVRGYTEAEHIVYGTGAITKTEDIREHAVDLLADEQVTFVDVRSARNNCFQCRIVSA